MFFDMFAEFMQNYRLQRYAHRFQINFTDCLELPTWFPTIIGHIVQVTSFKAKQQK